jgi:hypothetical protein
METNLFVGAEFQVLYIPIDAVLRACSPRGGPKRRISLHCGSCAGPSGRAWRWHNSWEATVGTR